MRGTFLGARPHLAARLTQANSGALVRFTDWRGDPDQRLTDDGLTVAQTTSATTRGALVRGLLQRSHLDRLRLLREENRDLLLDVSDVSDVGDEVELDQRVRPFGSHHQKFVVIHHSK